MPDPETASPIRWDNSNLHELTGINFCTVTTKADEIALLLGTGTSEAGRVSVDLKERIPLQPVAAKLLRDLLQQNVAQYEANHGRILQGYQPLPGSESLPASPAATATWPAELSPRAALLRELVEALPAPHELERSWKFEPGALKSERFLLGLSREELGATASIRLPVVWKRLGMPESYLAEARRELLASDHVHFGFEGSDGGCIYKLYLEQSQSLAAEGDGARWLYTGYKWNPEAPEQCAISRYWARPRLSTAALQESIAAELSGAGVTDILNITSRLVELAAERVDPARLLLVEVKDEDGRRSSLDLNLYSAALLVSELYPLLAELARAFALPLAQLRSVYEEVKHCTLGHVSAGTSRSGQPFFTIYYGGHTARA